MVAAPILLYCSFATWADLGVCGNPFECFGVVLLQPAVEHSACDRLMPHFAATKTELLATLARTNGFLFQSNVCNFNGVCATGRWTPTRRFIVLKTENLHFTIIVWQN